MSNPVLLSNEASALKSLLSSTSEWSPFTYSIKSNCPNISRSRITVAGSTAAALAPNRAEAFAIPRYGLLAGAVARIKIKSFAQTAISAANWSNWLGIALLKSATLSTHNRVIQTIPSSALLFEHTYARSANERHTDGYLAGENAGYDASLKGTTATNFKELTFYVKLPLTFCGSTSSYVDTSFLESLTINLQLADAASSVYLNGATTDWAYSGVDMLFDFISMPDGARKALQTENYSLDRPLSMLGWNYYAEQKQTVSIQHSATTTGDLVDVSVDLRCNGVCTHTFWRIRQTTTKDTNGNVTADDKSHNSGTSIGAPVYTYDETGTGAVQSCSAGWERVQLTASGAVLIDNNVSETLLGYGGDMGRSIGAASTSASTASAGSYSTDTDGFNVICHGLDARSVEKNYDGGSMSFKELVAPTLTVSIRPVNLTNNAILKTVSYELEVLHRVLVLNSVSSSDGRVTQSISV